MPAISRRVHLAFLYSRFYCSVLIVFRTPARKLPARACCHGRGLRIRAVARQQLIISHCLFAIGKRPVLPSPEGDRNVLLVVGLFVVVLILVVDRRVALVGVFRPHGTSNGDAVALRAGAIGVLAVILPGVKQVGIFGNYFGGLGIGLRLKACFVCFYKEYFQSTGVRVIDVILSCLHLLPHGVLNIPTAIAGAPEGQRHRVGIRLVVVVRVKIIMDIGGIWSILGHGNAAGCPLIGSHIAVTGRAAECNSFAGFPVTGKGTGEVKLSALLLGVIADGNFFMAFGSVVMRIKGEICRVRTDGLVRIVGVAAGFIFIVEPARPDHTVRRCVDLRDLRILVALQFAFHWFYQLVGQGLLIL